MAYLTNGVIGGNVATTTTGTTTDGENALFQLGTISTGTDGTEWIYVQAGEAVTQYDCVAIDENFQMLKMTKTLADAGQRPGFAQVAFSDNDLGWVALSGSNIKVNALTSCQPDVQLYTTGTAGKLDDTAASQTAIRGVVAISSATAGTTALEVIASNPSATATV